MVGNTGDEFVEFVDHIESKNGNGAVEQNDKVVNVP